MGALERASRALLGAFGEARGAFAEPAIPSNTARGLLAKAGVSVSTDTAMAQITFYRGVQILADAVSTLPLRAIEQTLDGARKALAVKPRALVDPFVGLSVEEGMSQIVTSLAIRGNAYLAAVEFEGGYGAPTRWRILHPDQVVVRWGSSGEREYLVNSKLWTAELVHVTGFMLPGAVKGAGIIEYCRNALGLGIALDDVASTFFRNGVMSTGIISVDGTVTPDDARAIAKQFQQNHAGTRQAHLPVVMGGGASYTPISLTPEDAQFIESRQFQAGQIATLLGIPPHMLGLVDKTTSWGTGIESQGRGFVDYTIRGYISRLQTMFTAWLVDGLVAELDTDQLTRATTTERFKTYQVALGQGGGIGFMNVDEIRALEGLAPLPDGAGAAYYISSTMVPAGGPQADDDDAEEQAEPTEPTATDADQARSAAEVVQKVYLGVGPVLTAEEARDLIRRSGADISGPLPAEAPAPAPKTDPIPADDEADDDAKDD